MADFIATYSIRFRDSAAQADLTAARLEQHLSEDLNTMHMLFEEIPERELIEDGFDGVEPGHVEVLEIRDLEALHREYDVRHGVGFSSPGPAGMEPLERFGRYLNEALGVPQTESLIWRIDELTVMSLDAPVESVAAQAG